MAVYTHPSTTYPALPWIDVPTPNTPPITATATQVAYTLTDGTEVHIFGSSFTYDGNGDPTGGTVDSITRTVSGGGTVLEQVTGNGGGSLGLSLAALVSQGDGFGPVFNFVLSGADTVTGNTGNDYLYGGPGADALNGAGGTDIADYTAAAVGLTVDLGTTANNTGDAVGDTYSSIEGIRGSAFNDSLRGDGGANTLIGGAGNDFLRGRGGADALDGGSGTDWADYLGASTGVTVNLGNAASNTGDANGDTFISIEGIRGSNNADTLTGGLVANDGFEGYYALGGNDTITGGSGYDEVRYDQDAGQGGTAGVTVNLATGTATDGFGNTDTLSGIEAVRGTNQADTLTGGLAANDSFGEYFYGLGGNDTISGGSGFDEVRYDQDANFGGALGVTVNLATGTATDGFGNTDTLSGIEAVRGTNQADTLTGSSDSNNFYGLGGNDIFSGGDGFDEIRYDRDDDFGGLLGVTVNLATATATDGFGNTDTLSGINGVRGTVQADVLIGSTFLGFYDEEFYGLAGNDTISGAGGFDAVRYDRDASFGGTAGVTVNLASGTAVDGFGNTDTLSGIEGVRGTNQADAFTGNAGFNYFYGLGGNDTINGGGEEDETRYDRDADNGGTAGVTVNLALGTATDGFGNTDTLISIERARGTNQADSLTGSDANNQLMGLGGNDTINGGLGTDEVRYDSDFNLGGMSGVTVNLATGTATDAFGNTDTLTSIENARGTRFNDTFTGSSDDNVFYGLAGNDNINGGAGSDWTSYSNDIFNRDESQTLAAVVVNLGTGSATDSYGGTDTLTSIENAAGGTLSDTLIGSSGDNIFRGLAGNDLINGAGGVDTVDYSTDSRYGAFVFMNGSNGVTVNLAAGTATDGFGNTDTLSNIENAIGTEFADTFTGASGVNVFTGGAGDDTYFLQDLGDLVAETAGQGNDLVHTTVDYTLSANVESLVLDGSANINGIGNSDANYLQGNSGNNILDGLGGGDFMVGGAGNDSYYVDSAGDVVVENAGAGNDVVHATFDYTIGANIEAVVLEGSGNINAVGSSNADYLQGNSGNNILDGLGGGDFMVGGAGNDSYYVESAGDTVVENAGAGNDVVHATFDYTLGANIEAVVLEGSGNINAVGSSNADYLQGNSGNNILDGLGGGDFMVGGAGDDSYYVDSAGDTIVENAGAGNDVVHATFDYTIGANIEAVVLEGSGNINAVGSSNADYLQGNSGNNILDGLGGGDFMVGGAGDDSYYVDSAGDTIVENAGAGNDVVHATFDYTLGANIEAVVLEGSGNINAVGNSAGNYLQGNSGNNGLDGQGGSDFMVGGGGNDTFIFNAGQGNGDVISDFDGNGAGAGDQLLFVGYGAGATFTNIDATHWQINYNGGASHDVITFSNAAAIGASDWLFV